MRAPNLNALKMFDAAARHLNFRLAAEEMNLTQGAVAQQVRRLEADLGHRLFHRKARGLELTRTGRSYHDPIRRALHIIDEATRTLMPDNTRVTLSVPPSFAAKWLVPRLQGFEGDHPGIDLQVLADEGLATFRADGVDIAVRQGQPPFDGDIEHALLSPLDLTAVAGVDLAQRIGRVTGIDALGAYPLIQDGHRHWDRLIRSGQIAPQGRSLQFNQTALAMDAARNGQGIALVPKIFLGGPSDTAGLVPLWALAGESLSGFYLIWPKDKKAGRAVQDVRAWLLGQHG